MKWNKVGRPVLAIWFGIVPGFVLSGAETNQVAEARFLSNIRQLTYEGRRSGEGYFSPDGKALIFQSEREAGNPFYQIYILDLESGESHRVSPGIGKTTCGFFRPRSDEVLFASTHHDPDARAKQKAELDFRASGKQRRYSWDYDDHMDIWSARRDETRGLVQLVVEVGASGRTRVSAGACQDLAIPRRQREGSCRPTPPEVGLHLVALARRDAAAAVVSPRSRGSRLDQRTPGW